MDTKRTEDEKRPYSKPEIKKHKPVAVVASASCSSDNCNQYCSRTSGGGYYH